MKNHGDPIKIADLAALQTAANNAPNEYGRGGDPQPDKLGPFFFPPPILAVDTFAQLTSLYEADCGQYPGAIVAVKEKLKAYQINGDFRQPASWVEYPGMLVTQLRQELISNYGAPDPCLGYEFETRSIWAFRIVSGFNSPRWWPFSLGDPDKEQPEQDSGFLQGLRGEIYRAWFQLSSFSLAARTGGLGTYFNQLNLAQKSYLSTNQPDRYCYTGNQLAIREPWTSPYGVGTGYYGPLPVVEWLDRYVDIAWIFDPALNEIPNVRCTAHIASMQNPSFYLADNAGNVGTSPDGNNFGALYRIKNAILPGRLEGTFTFNIISDHDEVQPLASDFAEPIKSWITSFTIVSHFVPPGDQNTYINWSVSVAWKAPFPYDPSNQEIYINSSYWQRTLDQTQPTMPVYSDVFFTQYGSAASDWPGINATGPLTSILVVGCRLGNQASLTMEIKDLAENSQNPPAWRDVTFLTAYADGPGCFLALPAPIGFVDTASLSYLQNYVLKPSSSTGYGPAAALPPAQAGTKLYNVVSEAVEWRSPRWPARRDTEPDYPILIAGVLYDPLTGIIRLKGPIAGSGQSFIYACIKEVYIGRMPADGDPKHLIAKAADRQPLTIQIGCIRAGAFHSFTTVAMAAADIGITLRPEWPIFSHNLLVYQCSERLNVQAMIIMPNPPTIEFNDYSAARNQNFYPLSVFSYNDLLLNFNNLILGQ